MDRIFHFGKYKGVPIEDVPSKYLDWVIRNLEDSRAVNAAVYELQRRGTRLLNETNPNTNCSKQPDCDWSRKKNLKRNENRRHKS
ncbi:MAG: hypothetical protein Fues2KO_46920 [Fuerstiella sp.]